MRKITTLVYLLKDETICLGKKKRGFGEGLWNGYGGKVEEGEEIIDAVIRELKEESGVDAHEDNCESIGTIEFFFKDGTEIETHIFFIRTWESDPIETEEMAPQWFSYEEIPYGLMWQDDQYWLPRALKGETLQGKVWFSKDGKSITQMEWNFNLAPR